MKNDFSIVPVKEIPEAHETPTDDLLFLFKVFSQLEFLCEKYHGLGLSAVQVGIPWKSFVIAPRSKNAYYRYFVDCEYVSNDDKFTSVEGCLSIPSEEGGYKQYAVPRFKSVIVTGKELLVSPELRLVDVKLELNGLESVIFQHEIDHSNQILISDIGQEVEVRK